MQQETEKGKSREVHLRRVSSDTRFEGTSELIAPREAANFEGYTFLLLFRETKTYMVLIITDDIRIRREPLAFGAIYQLDDQDLYFKGTSSRSGQTSKIRLDIGPAILPLDNL